MKVTWNLENNMAIVDGHILHLDRMHWAKWTIEQEQYETSLVESLVREGNIAVDIGAHVGYYTLLLAKLVGKEGKVYAFEPEPTNFAILKQNVRENGYGNVILEQKAVSNKTGTAKLYLSENTQDNRIFDSHDNRPSIDIETVKLDDYFDSKDTVDFIKIDIQGAEPLAIEGMMQLLNKNRNIKLAGEFWPMALKALGIYPRRYIDMLIQGGFSMLWDINEAEGTLVPISDPDAYIKRVSSTEPGCSNIFAMKGG